MPCKRNECECEASIESLFDRKSIWEEGDKCPACKHPVRAHSSEKNQPTVLPCVDMRSVVKEHRCADLSMALRDDLPFKIPVSEPLYVQQFLPFFTLSKSTIDKYVASFLEYFNLGRSETTTVAHDVDWLRIINYSLYGVDFTLNQYDDSSVALKRPDATVQINSAVAMKVEAKYNKNELNTAVLELTDKLHPDAFKVFPKGCNYIIGIASSVGWNKISVISYDRVRRKYSAGVVREYSLGDLAERVRFLVDLMKICRWMASITDRNSNFHLIPDVRLTTNNNHHITWNAEGIQKEFNHRRDMSTVLDYIHQVYTHDPKPRHIEYGRVLNNRSILITRIGNKLTHRNIVNLGLTVESVIKQVQEGLEELHEIGFAHCDVSVNNVFIDDDGVVFLDDLEYLTPVNDPAPHFTRLPVGVTVDQVQSAKLLDEYQFELFSAEVLRL